MKITIESTGEMVTLNGVPARIWAGRTDAGVPVSCFINHISPQTHDPAVQASFEAELSVRETPRPEAIPLRFIL